MQSSWSEWIGGLIQWCHSKAYNMCTCYTHIFTMWFQYTRSCKSSTTKAFIFFSMALMHTINMKIVQNWFISFVPHPSFLVLWQLFLYDQQFSHSVKQLYTCSCEKHQNSICACTIIIMKEKVLSAPGTGMFASWTMLKLDEFMICSFDCCFKAYSRISHQSH